ncbi:uncharacterized protein LOC135221423 [Macrobrachium nipponense]|uniref:uncharacterized protein LOC135221423 n=1 Tax=Macrobrachium nipponense TaxID=159736 RepID=UPI0030C8A465
MVSMKDIIATVFGMAVIAVVSGHTLHLGRSCPDIQPFPNLSVDKILGLWYVVHKFDTDNTCLVWNLTLGELPDTLQVKETRQLSLLDAIRVDHTHSVTANINIPNPEVPAKMRIRWPTSLTGNADFIVFDTDYDSYMAVFECDRAGVVHRRSASILSRTPAINDMFVRRVRRLLDTVDVSHHHLSSIEHNTCRQSGRHNWHVDEELFGLLPGFDEADVRSRVSEGVHDYDISQLEIVGEGIEQNPTFKGSYNNGRTTL